MTYRLLLTTAPSVIAATHQNKLTKSIKSTSNILFFLWLVWAAAGGTHKFLFLLSFRHSEAQIRQGLKCPSCRISFNSKIDLVNHLYEQHPKPTDFLKTVSFKNDAFCVYTKDIAEKVAVGAADDPDSRPLQQILCQNPHFQDIKQTLRKHLDCCVNFKVRLFLNLFFFSANHL